MSVAEYIMEIIKVVDVRSDILDLKKISREDLESVIQSNESIKSLLTPFIYISDLYQGVLSNFLQVSGERIGSSKDGYSKDNALIGNQSAVAESIQARIILNAPSVKAIVLKPLTGADDLKYGERDRPGFNDQNILSDVLGLNTPYFISRTRPSTKIEAVDINGQAISIPEEEAITIGGFLIDVSIAGSIISKSYGCPPLSAAALHGPAAVLSSLESVRFPEYPVDTKLDKKLKTVIVPLSSTIGETTSAILRALRSSVDYYFSNYMVAYANASINASIKASINASINASIKDRTKYVNNVNTYDVNKITDAVVLKNHNGTTWQDEITSAKLAEFIQRLSLTESVLSMPPGALDMIPISDIYKIGALPIYYVILTEGRDAPEVTDFLELSMAKMNAIKAAAATDIKMKKAAYQARQYLAIARDLFGPVRFAKIIDSIRVVKTSRVQKGAGGSLAAGGMDMLYNDDYEAVLNALTSSERKLLLVEYERRTLELASLGKKCPHFALVSKMRRASTAAEALKILKELEGFLSADPESKWLVCKVCKARALCPHVKESIELTAANASYDKMRQSLEKYSQLINESEDLNSYFCMYCAERFAEILVSEPQDNAVQAGRFGDLEAGFRNKIWGMIASAASNIKFPSFIEGRTFASASIDNVYVACMVAEEAELKANKRPGARVKAKKVKKVPKQAAKQTATSYEIPDVLSEDEDPNKIIRAALFVYAYILHLVVTSQQGRPNEAIGFAKVPMKSKAGVYADTMLKVITSKFSRQLSQLEDTSLETLRTRFADAYRIIKNDGTIHLQITDASEEFLRRVTVVDPVYTYALNVAKMVGDVKMIKQSGPRTSEQAVAEFQTVFNADLPSIMKRAASIHSKDHGESTEESSSIKNTENNLYRDLYQPSVDKNKPTFGKNDVDSFYSDLKDIKSLLKSAKGQLVVGGRAILTKMFIAKTSQHISAAQRGSYLEAYRLLHSYTTMQFDTFNTELEKYKKADKLLSSIIGVKAVKPFDPLIDYKLIGKPNPIDRKKLKDGPPLSYLFDETGLPHDWSEKVLYIFSTGNKKNDEVVINIKEVAKARAGSDKLDGATLVDIQCTGCGTRWSQIDKLDIVKVEKMVIVAKKMQSFFECFESRCPAAANTSRNEFTYSLHKWKKDKDSSTCEYCGLSSQTLKSAGEEGVKYSLAVKNKDALVYYEKYVDVFQQARDEILLSMSPISKNNKVHVQSEQGEQACTKAAAEWKPNYTLLMRAAEIGKVTPALIEAFGATKGRYYNDILNGVNPPNPPSSKTDPRIYVANAAGRTVARDLSQLCAVWRTPLPAPWATEMLKNAKVQPSEFSMVDQVFMPIARDVSSCARNNLFTYIINTRSPETALMYATESFSRIVCDVLDAAAGKPEYIQEVAKLFAYRSVQKVAHSAKILSKNEWFNFNLFTENPETDSALDSIEDDPEEVNITEEGGENDILDAVRQIDFDITDNGGDDS